MSEERRLSYQWRTLDDLKERDYDALRIIKGGDCDFAMFKYLFKSGATRSDASDTQLEACLDRLASARRIVCDETGVWRIA